MNSTKSNHVKILTQQLEESQEKLKKANDDYRTLIDSLDEIIWTVDVLTAKLQMSAACERIFGYKSEELTSVFDVWTRLVNPSDHRQLELANEDLAKGISVKKQCRITHRDGSMKWIEMKMIPTINEDHELISINGITRDITKEKKTQKALLESEFLFRQFFDGAHEAILILDIETGRMCDYNTSALKLLKYTGTEMLNQTPVTLSPLYQPDGRLSSLESAGHTKKALEGKNPKFEWVFMNSDGKEIICEVRLSLIIAYGRKLIRGSVIDITERKKVEEEVLALNDSLETKVRERTAELMEVNRELEAFNCTVSHDLQAPLRAVSGFSKLILSHYSDALDADGKEMLQIMNASTLRMSRLIRELLDFAKLGKVECHKESVKMDELVHEVIDEVRFNQHNNTAEITTVNICDGCCDPNLIRQVWVNLISNAVKYSAKKEKPVIEIGSETLNGELTYYVRDNGAGFDMSHAQKLFSVFKRLHSDNDFEGTGVGLATAHRIVTRQGGRIWAEAKPNLGATFYFTLAA
jgi:PAS domain S-box-containing protein